MCKQRDMKHAHDGEREKISLVDSREWFKEYSHSGDVDMQERMMLMWWWWTQWMEVFDVSTWDGNLIRPEMGARTI